MKLPAEVSSILLANHGTVDQTTLFKGYVCKQIREEVTARLQDQPLVGGGTLEVVANSVVGCDSFKQKQVIVRCAGEHITQRELCRHWGLLQLKRLR
jgi:hypothetical protein